MTLLERITAFLSRRSAFAQNVLKLSTGTILRTVIALGTVPIVARLYTPENFGDLQLMLAIATTLASIGALKYEVAIVLPVDREESQQVALLSLCTVGAFALVLAIVTWLFGEWFLGLFDAERLQSHAWLIVVGFLAIALLRVSHHVLIASKQFGALARTSVYQVCAIQGSYVGLGLWNPTFLGMFASQMFGHVLGIVYSLWRAPIRLGAAGPRRLLALASRYRKFPLVNSPGVFVNTLAYEMPVFLLARFFSADVVGFYMLTDRLLGQPTALVGDAVAKVYLQSAAELRHEGIAELRRLFRLTAGRLFLIAAPFALVVLVAAPPVIAILLGERYREVGVLMQILVLGRFLAFVASPLIATFTIVNRQELAVVLMVLAAAVQLGAMLFFSDGPREMMAALAASNAGFCLIYLFTIDRLLGRMARAEAAERPPTAPAPPVG